MHDIAQAVAFGIDELKATVPIWKKEARPPAPIRLGARTPSARADKTRR